MYRTLTHDGDISVCYTILILFPSKILFILIENGYTHSIEK